MIERRGIIPAVERVVLARDDAAGYKLLVKSGLKEMAFDAVVLRHPDAFSDETIKAAKERLDRL